ncbi:MAG: hypothetical protein NT067_00705 [Candidatus Diapherotrites archaeon]|nr:hypothetical protein [Candidatus Diapherotrites archaeon]
MKKATIIFVLLLALLAFLGGCTENPAEMKAEFEVHEWGVMAGCSESGQFLLTSRPEQAMLVKQPVIYIHSKDLNEFDLRVNFIAGAPTMTYPSTAMTEDSAEWKKVKVLQNCLKAEENAPLTKGFEPVPLESIIPVLNDVDSACLQFEGTEARFLFYEGEMPFENKISAKYNTATGKATVKNNAGYAVYDLAVAVSKENSKAMAPTSFSALTGSIGELKAGEEKELALKENAEFLDLKQQMMAAGFTEKESESFGALWQESFFFPKNYGKFARLSYRLPAEEIDKRISLEFSPEPKKTLRALWVLFDLPATAEEKKTIEKGCTENADCGWVSTNCCPETAGAQWECINAAQSGLKCLPDTICPQVMMPKPETGCSCKNNTCTEEKKAAQPESPACGLETTEGQVSFSWTPASPEKHIIRVSRRGTPDFIAIEAEETMSGQFRPGEPLGDGEYYWQVSPDDQNLWSKECSLTIARNEITCEDIRAEMEKCWIENSGTIADGYSEYCGDLLGYENNCTEKALQDLAGTDGRFTLDFYRQCNRLAIYYNRSENLSPAAKYYNKIVAECYG